MKGHVGGGSVSARLLGVFDIVKAKSFHRSFSRFHYVNVQERLLEMSGFVREFHLGRIVHKLESLIMAQNERWRHA